MPCDAHARAREREGCTYTGRSNRIGGLNVTARSRAPLIFLEHSVGGGAARGASVFTKPFPAARAVSIYGLFSEFLARLMVFLSP